MPRSKASTIPPERVIRPANDGGTVREMFEDGKGLLRAVIAAEVLGPPRALREHELWSQRPNEPST